MNRSMIRYLLAKLLLIEAARAHHRRSNLR